MLIKKIIVITLVLVIISFQLSLAYTPPVDPVVTPIIIEEVTTLLSPLMVAGLWMSGWLILIHWHSLTYPNDICEFNGEGRHLPQGVINGTKGSVNR